MAIFRGILLQMICQHNELIPYCYSKMKSSLSSVLSDLATLNSLLETFCERVTRCYIVIDGLDECGDGAKEVLDIVKKLVNKAENHSRGKLRIALFSRPIPGIRKSLPEAEIFALEPEHTKVDIQNYCHYRTRELAKFNFGDADFNELVERITIRSDGMHWTIYYLWKILTSQAFFCSQDWS